MDKSLLCLYLKNLLSSTYKKINILNDAFKEDEKYKNAIKINCAEEIGAIRQTSHLMLMMGVISEDTYNNILKQASDIRNWKKSNFDLDLLLNLIAEDEKKIKKGGVTH